MEIPKYRSPVIQPAPMDYVEKIFQIGEIKKKEHLFTTKSSKSETYISFCIR